MLHPIKLQASTASQALDQAFPDFFQLASCIQDEQEVANLKQLMTQGLKDVDKLSNPAFDALAEYQESDAAWLERMLSYAPDPDQFQAGRMHACVGVLKEYFRLTDNTSANAKKVISWIDDGIKFPFVGVQHKSHDKAPHFHRKLEIVKQMLSKAVGSELAESCLQGKTPAPVHFPNHQSAQTNASFVDAELAKAEAKGVVTEWPFQQPPTVINGLLVVEGKKPRLCMNPSYINLFMQHLPVKYERLQDLVDLLHSEDYMSTSDDKSGFWQLPLHPSMWQYVGFEWRGRYMVFKMAPFGISVLPWIYTTFKQEVFRPLREKGVRMAFLIDDRAAAESSRPRARLQSEALTKVLLGLGTITHQTQQVRKQSGCQDRLSGFLA